MLSLTPDQDERARKVHRDAIVIDICITTNPAKPTPYHDGGYALDRLLKGGTSAANVAICSGNDNFRRAVTEINILRRFVKSASDKVVLVEAVSDIHKAKLEGKTGIVLFLHTSSPLEDDWFNTVPVLHALGVRVMQLTSDETNLLGSCIYEPTDNGLTAYGRQVVRALNANGIIVDASHAGEQTVRDAASWTNAPMIYSHINAYALFPNQRNAHDDTLKAVAETGGVIGTSAWDIALEREPGHQPTLSDLLDNLDYCANLVGIEHVGVGTDLNENDRTLPMQPAANLIYLSPSYQERYLPEFGWLSEFPNITRGLVERGYSDEDIKKIMGGNFLRVAEQVWGSH
jgi:membrane dipeptidase